MVCPWEEGKSPAELSSCREELLVTQELAFQGSSHQLGIRKGPDTKLGT